MSVVKIHGNRHLQMNHDLCTLKASCLSFERAKGLDTKHWEVRCRSLKRVPATPPLTLGRELESEQSQALIARRIIMMSYINVCTYCTISFNSDVTRHRPLQIVRNVTSVLCHIALVRKHWWAPMLNKEIKGLLWRRAGGEMTLSPSFWKVSETKISDKVSLVTPLSELNEMVQYSVLTQYSGFKLTTLET